MRFDIHVHSTISLCSQLPLQAIVEQAQAKGLDGVCITDHDTMAVKEQIQEGVQPNGLCVIFGMEYATTEGDFLLFGPFEDLRAGLAAPELLHHVAQSEGVAVAAHPFRSNRPTQEYLINNGMCSIVEGINGRNGQSENDCVASWEDRYAVKLVGGSDAHSVEELGRVSTLFSGTIRNRLDLIHSLQKGCFKPEWNQSHIFAAA